MKRSIFLASLGLTGCGYHLGNRLNDTQWIHKTIGIVQPLNHAVIGTRGMAKLYTDADVDRNFRTNGFDPPNTAQYNTWVRDDYRGYRLIVDGMVERPQAYTLAELRAFPRLAQITRHDCVEGWSAIGKWTGARLGPLLQSVGLKPEARYLVFHCADRLEGDLYYESIDLVDAFHEQTILAYDMNDKPLPVPHGAPLRLRVERQLGYKMAKYVMRV
ncbi:MAG: molybdopterin-dependent oxidoreductase, partial [Vulcanimicrobiaceae bacterium]